MAQQALLDINSIAPYEFIEAFKRFFVDKCAFAVEDLLLEIDSSIHYGFVVK